MAQKKLPEKGARLNKVVKKVERGIIRTLITLMSLLLILATLELAYLIVMMVIEDGGFLINLDSLMNAFGVFMLVLIGIELLDTIKVYFKEHVIHVEVVMLVALIAVARKVIVMDTAVMTGSEILGIAGIIIALSAGYYMIKRTGGGAFWPTEKEEEKDIIVEETFRGDEEETGMESQWLERKKTIKTRTQESFPKRKKKPGSQDKKDLPF